MSNASKIEIVGRAVVYRYLPTGIADAIKHLRNEVRYAYRHHKGFKEARRLVDRADLRLNVGCGRNIKPGWINIDLETDAEFHLDVRRDLPFADASASIIYSEHFFEHLEFSDAQKFLREALRVLRPGGVFSVVVPDASSVLKAYVNSDYELLKHLARFGPEFADTPMHQVNHAFRQWSEHKYMYDFETLSSVLIKAGFATAEHRNFDPKLDDPLREVGSLYVDARKATEGQIISSDAT